MSAATRFNPGLIAFGSNQGDSLQVFAAAINALRQIAGVTVVAHSQPTWTDPITGIYSEKNDDQPYLNAVIRVTTRLSPSELHLQTAAIEHQFGRVRSGHWQARVIDLDLLLLGDQIVDTRSLTVPHPRMSFRRFVLEPAAEIAAELTHPIANCTVATLLDRINSPDKTMALVCFESDKQTAALEDLIGELSKINLRWHFEKVFSAEKLLQLDSNLTVVVTFDTPIDRPFSGQENHWDDLRATAIGFAGPSLHLKTSPGDAISLKELAAVLQTIG